ncbi:MAG: TolC family protein [Candidatus Latescibacteria bacterium]|jgi:outer membrane protein|nr:TolC family protein [Candidatus Latescibacterota bacterium]MBT4137629.1 TolC family protein [Candidatus Latescibacterota bacterium]MBT5830937.1 TolC family protein [Candidatus Latescibacterota bacterium]
MTVRFFMFVLLICTKTLSSHAQPVQHLTLAQSLQHAQQNNETLLIAQQDLETSNHQFRESLADGLPQLDASLSYDRNWLLPNFVFGDQSVTIGAHNSLTGSIGIRQSLYSGGKLFASLKVARLFRQYSQENIRLVQQRVRRDVETAFYDLLLAYDLLRVNELSLARAQANYALAQKLFEAGRVSEYDLLRAQTQVAEIRPDSIQATNLIKLTTLSFKSLIGFPPETKINITGAFRQDTALLSKSESKNIALGLMSRPEIRQQDKLISMRKHGETVTQSSSRPTLDLIINGQWQAQKDNFKFSSNDFRQSWFSGLTLKVPLFDGFRTTAQVLQARADTRRAQLAFQQLERTLELEISQAQQHLSESIARKLAQEQTISLSKKGLRIAETRYSNGIGTQLEIIDAQLSVQRAEAALAQAKHDVAVALVSLEYSMGILGNQTATRP